MICPQSRSLYMYECVPRMHASSHDVMQCVRTKGEQYACRTHTHRHTDTNTAKTDLRLHTEPALPQLSGGATANREAWPDPSISNMLKQIHLRKDFSGPSSFKCGMLYAELVKADQGGLDNNDALSIRRLILCTTWQKGSSIDTYIIN